MHEFVLPKPLVAGVSRLMRKQSKSGTAPEMVVHAIGDAVASGVRKTDGQDQG